VFSDTVGATSPLLALNVVGNTTLTGNVLTLNAQSYSGSLTLAAATTLTKTSSVNGINIAGAIDGAYALTITATQTTANPSQTIVLGASIGANTALTSLAVTGPAQFDGTSITTTGAQTFNSALKLTNSTTIAATNAAIIFAQVNGTTVNTQG
jgi:hypothetical protein